MAEYDAVISARKGIMTRKVFDNIRRCLHPDSRQSASDERLAEAFRLFSKLELRLLSESDFPTRKLKPLNAADLAGNEAAGTTKLPPRQGQQQGAGATVAAQIFPFSP